MQLAAVILAVQSVIPVAGDSFSVACVPYPRRPPLWPLLPSGRAQSSHVAWLSAFVSCPVPPRQIASPFGPRPFPLVSLSLFAFIAALPAAAVSGVAAAPPEAAATPWVSSMLRWGFVIAALWAAATLFRAGDSSLIPSGCASLEGALRSILLIVSLLRRTLSGARCLQVCTTTALQRPRRNRILRTAHPYPLLAVRAPHSGELDQIVLHESEHLRRHDDWSNLCQKICLILSLESRASLG